MALNRRFVAMGATTVTLAALMQLSPRRSPGKPEVYKHCESLPDYPIPYKAIVQIDNANQWASLYTEIDQRDTAPQTTLVGKIDEEDQFSVDVHGYQPRYNLAKLYWRQAQSFCDDGRNKNENAIVAHMRRQFDADYLMHKDLGAYAGKIESGIQKLDGKISHARQNINPRVGSSGSQP